MDSQKRISIQWRSFSEGLTLADLWDNLFILPILNVIGIRQLVSSFFWFCPETQDIIRFLHAFHFQSPNLALLKEWISVIFLRSSWWSIKCTNWFSFLSWRPSRFYSPSWASTHSRPKSWSRPSFSVTVTVECTNGATYNHQRRAHANSERS